MDDETLDTIDRFVSGSEGNRLVVTVRPPAHESPSDVARTIRSLIEHIKTLHISYGPRPHGIMIEPPRTRPDGHTIDLVIRRMTRDTSSN